MANKSRYAMWRNESETSVTDQFPHNSIRNKTYNNVIETLLCLAWKHKFVEQVDAGDIWQVDLEKNTNEQQVQSDTLQILVDIIGAFRNGKQMTDPLDIESDPIYYIPEGDLVFNPFTERFDNAVTGWTLDIPVMIDYIFPACDNPFIVEEDGSPANCVQ